MHVFYGECAHVCRCPVFFPYRSGARNVQAAKVVYGDVDVVLAPVAPTPAYSTHIDVLSGNWREFAATVERGHVGTGLYLARQS